MFKPRAAKRISRRVRLKCPSRRIRACLYRIIKTPCEPALEALLFSKILFYAKKITHFDHERTPERIVHARGTGAHGYFQPYKSMKAYTKAAFLSDPAVKTPVFVRFSTVAGERGSTDMARDVRGFAVKFYTSEGNFDLVGNNIPVFFIQDAMKFPDLIHSVKIEPDRGFRPGRRWRMIHFGTLSR